MNRHPLPTILAVAAALLLLADAATSQIIRLRGQNGRVAGLAVSVTDQIPNGAGKDVELQVDMTTIRTEFTGDVVVGARGGQRIFDVFTTGEASTQRSGFGGLGDADLNSTFRVSDSPGRSFTGFVYFSNQPIRAGFSGVYQGNALTFTHTSRSYIEGELPAIDYGDGGPPLDLTSLAPFGTPSTSNPTSGVRRITSRWRGSFVHTYSDLGSYTVTAASRCCPWRDEIFVGDDDVEQERGMFDVGPGYVVPPNSPSQLAFSETFENRLVFSSAYPDTFIGSNRGDGYNGTFTSGNQFSGTGSDLRSLAQVTNTVQVAEGLGGAFAIRIPTAGTYGLALLSLLMAAGGILLLRR